VKKAFTMMELVFVIVILGILAAIAMPKLWVTRDDALYTKTKSQISSIRAGISSAYSKNVMAGMIDKCPETEKDASKTDKNLFENVLATPIEQEEGEINWTIESNDSYYTKYKLKIGDDSTTFTYEKNPEKSCPFYCDSSDELCKRLK
jgi:general secretion pathway protein G